MEFIDTAHQYLWSITNIRSINQSCIVAYSLHLFVLSIWWNATTWRNTQSFLRDQGLFVLLPALPTSYPHSCIIFLCTIVSSVVCFPHILHDGFLPVSCLYTTQACLISSKSSLSCSDFVLLIKGLCSSTDWPHSLLTIATTSRDWLLPCIHSTLCNLLSISYICPFRVSIVWKSLSAALISLSSFALDCVAQSNNPFILLQISAIPQLFVCKSWSYCLNCS